MTLTPAQESALLAAARTVPDARRDEFFQHTADALRHLRHIDLDDVRRAVEHARNRCGINMGAGSRKEFMPIAA